MKELLAGIFSGFVMALLLVGAIMLFLTDDETKRKCEAYHQKAVFPAYCAEYL